MRFLYAKFKGYIGFFNGCGLEEITIDFSKCRNRIVLIHGINGSGKSTLLNALSVFPDGSNCFVPNMDAEKQLRLFSEGDVYDIRIVSPCDSKGNRKQAKAYICKNGLELNTNGNITSYKEIIFSEFDLDSNYISLSKLSSDDRGLGDKTPAERKRFVANIIDNLETYNEIFKTLNKKSLIFKSHINTLHTKIQNIGIKEALETTLASLRVKEQEIQNEIMRLNNMIISIEAKTSIDENEASKINCLYAQSEELKKQLDSLLIEIKSSIHKTQIAEKDINRKYKEDNALYQDYEAKVSELRSLLRDKTNRMNSVQQSINSMKIEIESLSGDLDKELESKYDKSKKRLAAMEEEMCKSLIPNYPGLEIKIERLLELYKNFILKLDYIYSIADSDELKFLSIGYDPKLLPNMISLRDDYSKELEEVNQNIYTEEQNAKIISLLDKRHPKCTFDDCAFIQQAVELKNDIKYSSKRLTELYKRREELQQLSIDIDKNIEKVTQWEKDKLQFDVMIQSIIDNSDIFKVVKDELMSNVDEVLKAISNHHLFNDQRDPRKYIDLLNLLEMYEDEKKTNLALSYEYKSFQEKIKLINSTRSMISVQEKELNQLSKETISDKQNIDHYISLLTALEKKISDEAYYCSIYDKYIETCKQKDIVDSRLKEYDEKSSKATEMIAHIQEYRNNIDKLTSDLQPISAEANRISGQLLLLDSYYSEYNQYKEKFDMIEILKKYCSPTGGGIQTIFMQLYMSKLLTLSNQVLQMLFNGEYRLLDFVINQNEFRMPFVGSGLPVDDISSGSRSQVCMMSMVINLILLYQASTKYNIARLDEIDDGLDIRNKMEFLNVLNHIIQILNIEQLFIISHSIEADTSNVDIIKLKTYLDFEDTMTMGNIIYDYSEEIKKTIN